MPRESDTRTPRPLSPEQLARLDALRQWGHLLDTVFRIPGTSVRLGLDPILGFIPGLGDLVSPIFGMFVIVQAFRLRLPRVVQLRMVLNVVIDAAMGAIPFVGDLFDVVWRANARNLHLLERHAYEFRKPGAGDYVFVVFVLSLAAAAAALPLVVTLWLIERLG